MINLALPGDDAVTVFKNAASRTRDKVLRASLLAEHARVKSRTADYLMLAFAEQLFTMEAQDTLGVAKDLLYDVYDRVVVAGKERPLYTRLKAGARYKRCPLCGERDVKTLDHYLPKAVFPEFAVFPGNLIPCCSDCNTTKGTYWSNTHQGQLFHPYFDDWGDHQLLKADIEISSSAIDVNYRIDAPAGCNPGIVDRARSHFGLLQLKELYASKAAVELVQSKETFRRHYADGAHALQNELLHTAKSRLRSNINAWQPVLYKGLADCPQFYEGAFELIDEP